MIKLDILKLFLEKKGWTCKETSRKGLLNYIEPIDEEGFDPYEILLPQNPNINPERYIRSAIEILSESTEQSYSSVETLIDGLNFDAHRFRVKTPESSIPIDLMSNLLESGKRLLTSAADITFATIENAISSERFISECRFGHTYKGSFGVQLESPLDVLDDGNGEVGATLFSDIEEPLGRKITQRINRGFVLMDDAYKHFSSSYIVDQIGENVAEIKSFSEFSKYIDLFGRNDVNYCTAFSAMVNSRIQNVKEFKIRPKGIEFMMEALGQYDIPAETVELTVIGFPQTFTKPPSMMENLDGGQVKVKGTSAQLEGASISLNKFFLENEDYKKAIDAHKNLKNVKVVCSAKKMQRGWKVKEVISFSVLTD